MTGWVLTAGLTNLRAQINAWAPDRATASDGTIGDKAHQAEVSGHNPDDTLGSRAEWNGDADTVPEVRAWDCTSAFGNGVPAQVVVDHIRSLPGVAGVLRYMIFNRKIYHAPSFHAADYTGPSPHTEHIHFDGAWTQAADENTTFNYKLGVIPVSLTDQDKTWIHNEIAAIVARDAPQADGTPTSKVGRLAFDQGIPDGTDPEGARDKAWAVLRNLGVKLREVEAKVDALAAPVTPPPPAGKSATL